ncbi:hypothetical protein ACS0TY_016611 [Phlomoides rotata]
MAFVHEKARTVFPHFFKHFIFLKKTNKYYLPQELDASPSSPPGPTERRRSQSHRRVVFPWMPIAAAASHASRLPLGKLRSFILLLRSITPPRSNFNFCCISTDRRRRRPRNKLEVAALFRSALPLPDRTLLDFARNQPWKRVKVLGGSINIHVEIQKIKRYLRSMVNVYYITILLVNLYYKNYWFT